VSQQINLFNPIFLKQKKQFSATALAQGMGLIVIGSILVGFYARYQYSTLGDQEAASALELRRTTDELAKVTATLQPRQKSKALEEEIPRAEEAVRAQQQVFDVVRKGGFGNTSGYSDYLRAFARQIVNGVWLTGFRIESGGTEIELRGRTLQPELVPAYITRLKKEAAMQGKSFATLNITMPEDNPAAAATEKKASAPADAGLPNVPAALAMLSQAANPGPAAAPAPAPAPSSATPSPAPSRPPAHFMEFTLRTAGFEKDSAGKSASTGLLPSLPIQIPGIPKDISDMLGGARK
jgi:Tfp pilus assembly protein PilN